MSHYSGSVPEPERPTDWRAQALCAGPDFKNHRDLWFPQPGDKKARREAQAVCKACPVRQDCLDAALAEEGGRTSVSRFGIRGGYTEYGRRHLYDQARTQQRRASAAPPETPVVQRSGRPKAPCGTDSAYDRHVRNGEPIDQACRDAHARKSAEYRRTLSVKRAAA